MSAPLTRRAALAASAALFNPRPASAGAARELAVGTVSDPITLDPALAGSFFENQQLYNLHATLLVAQPDGSVLPGLAEACEVQGPLRYVLRLRAGLTFHDGTVLDADAVCANIARYTDPAMGSIRRADFGPLSKAIAIGPRDVELQFSAPYAPLPLVLTGRAGMMVSPTAWARLGADFGAQAVGCGPFRLAAWQRNASLTLEAFPGYWQGTPPGFDRLAFRPIGDDAARLANLRSGTVRLIDAVPPQSLALVRGDPALQLRQMPGIGFNAWSFNCTRPPFDARAIRRAFAAAIDPEVVHRVVYFGTGQLGRGPIPPAVGWAFDADGGPPRYDPAAARAALAQSGVSVPLPVTLTVTTSPPLLRAAQVIQAQAGAAGFAVTLRQIDPTGLLSVLKRRDFDICMSPWSGRYDPDGNMFNWFTRDGPNNFAGYNSEELTELLHRARSALDRAERAALYRQAQRIVADAVPMLFMHTDAVIQASSADLQWTQYPDAVFRLFDARSTPG